MTQEFQQMLQLAAIGATGHSIEVDCTDIDWKKVIAVAKKQKVDCYVAYALKNNKDLPCPAEIRDPLIKEARSLVFSNALHRSAIIQLLEEMEAAGIHAVLLKGYAICDCYALPESRTSSDADIWVDLKDEERACEFMRKQGFTVDPRWKNGHHAVCHHPALGCVELHVILYDEIVEDVWFGKMDGSEYVREPHMLVDSEDGNYYTLGYTDHFIFLVLHMIKHFILSGLTLQMMLDVALYFKKYAGKIDTDRAWNTISSLHYDKLFNCILRAMVQYCGFSKPDFPGTCSETSEQMETILDDLEEGGWMGCADKAAREEGWQEYNRQVLLRSKSKLGYWLHMIGWKIGMFKTALFPPVHKLQQKFSYAKRFPALLPIAWLHRLIFRGSKAVKNGALTKGMILNDENLKAPAKARVSLFKELEML
ncbi:MAG: nucleotidyltransferase family protein [Clostridia bacterium]|nr:nucleotidyltransferase family protein [Clostridia bacterium]